MQKLQRDLPNCQITWIIGKAEASLMTLLPNVELIVFDKKQGKQAFKELRAKLHGRQFDALLHLQANFRANLVSLCISAKRRIGFAKERARELQWLFTNEKAPISGEHVAEGFMDFATALGLKAEKPSWAMPIPTDLLEKMQAHKDQRPLLLLCPSASKAERNWTTEGYCALLQNAKERGFKTILVGGPAAIEVQLGQKICALAPVDENLIGQTRLTELLALIKLADVLVSPDTGPAHMATLVGTPVLGLYAAQTPARTGPYLSLEHVVNVYDEALLAETGKTVQEVSWRTRVKAKDAMTRIKVEDVLNNLEQLSSCIMKRNNLEPR
ncbi:MAG: glycosyltransferase family 9 protein [Venatoribacter sp.]